MKRFALTLFIAASVAAIPLAGCDSAGSGDGPSFRLRMTDFPFDQADSAMVTVRRIELRSGDEGAPFVLYAGPEIDFNLLDFQDGRDTTLGIANLTTSGYDQVRIIVAPDARVVMNDGTVFPLMVPSGAQTGIKINLPEVAASDGVESVDLLVDFDVERSFVTLGPPSAPHGFIFRPVLRIDSLYIDGAPVSPSAFPDDGEGDIYEGG